MDERKRVLLFAAGCVAVIWGVAYAMGEADGARRTARAYDERERERRRIEELHALRLRLLEVECRVAGVVTPAVPAVTA